MPDWKSFLRERLVLPELEDGGEERICDELADHLEQLYEEEIACGESAAAAEAHVADQLGDFAVAAQELITSGRFRTRSAVTIRHEDVEASLRRRGGVWSMMSDVLRDVRHALRTLRRSPGFHLLVVLIFALGIGASTAIFSVLNTVLFDPLPFPEPDRLATIWTPPVGYEGVPLSAPDFHDYRQVSDVFSVWGVYNPGRINLTQGESPIRLESVQCTAGLMQALGVSPAHGRLFTEADEHNPDTRLVLLSDHLWRSRFNADSSLVGETILLNREPHLVVGILPEEFRFPGWRSLWKADLYPLLSVPTDPATRGSQYLFGIGRLAEGASLEHASQALNTIASRLAEEYPEANHRRIASVVPLRDIVIGESGRPLWILMGAVGFLLLIACSNVAGLLLARTTARSGELAIRAALGAGRGRLIRQLLVEGCVLSLAGGAAGFALAWWGVGILRGLIPNALPRVAEVSVDSTVLLFTLGLSLVTGIVFGLLPALSTSRVDLSRTIRECKRSQGTDGRKSRFLSGLVVVQFALALVLINGEALMLKSLWNATGSRELREPEQVLIAGLSPDGPRYEESGVRARLLDELYDRLRNLPGVESVGASTRLPLSYGWTGHVLVEGEDFDPEIERPMTWYVCAGGDYFDAMGIPLFRGRALKAGDDEEGAMNVVVNRTFADRYWPGEDPLGKRVRGNWEPPWFEGKVVGVVEDVRQSGLESPVSRELYLPFFPPFLTDLWLVVRTTGDPGALTPAIRRELAAIDPELPLSSVLTGEQLYDTSAGSRRFNTLLLGLFAAGALFLIAAGAYGVLAFDVVRRRHEIGVRATLGADTESIVRLVLSRGLKLALLGVTFGLIGAIASARLLDSLLYQVDALYPVSLGVAAGFLLLIGLLASIVPALRAASIDPVEALQSD
jgi:putative ABC transport system permease protein